MKFAEEFTDVFIKKPKLLNDIWFSDECYFWMNGYVKKQNMRSWSDENPYAIEEAPLHLEKVTVWAALSCHGIIGPVFIRETITSDSYYTSLSEDVYTELENRGHLRKEIKIMYTYKIMC